MLLEQLSSVINKLLDEFKPEEDAFSKPWFLHASTVCSGDKNRLPRNLSFKFRNNKKLFGCRQDMPLNSFFRPVSYCVVWTYVCVRACIVKVENDEPSSVWFSYFFKHLWLTNDWEPLRIDNSTILLWHGCNKRCHLYFV